MLSIDQNSTSLWDTLPKLHALAAANLQTLHCVEDVDVAFTRIGGKPDQPDLQLLREQFHPSGQQDWGAAAFYHAFLGRLPLELHALEPMLGMKLPAAAKQLDLSMDELYDRHAVSDNWMLVGSSYLGDKRHHRLIGDLTVAETAPFLKDLLDRARADCLYRFPAKDCTRRTNDWFDAETTRLDDLLDTHADGTLDDLYESWLAGHLGDSVRLGRTSALPGLGLQPDRNPLAAMFLADYATLADLYNRAVRETDLGLHELDTDRGELPFFAILRRNGRLVRTGLALRRGSLRAGEITFDLPPGGDLPAEALQNAGVLALPGKAVVLALQVRLGPDAKPLALPHLGSPYTPATHRLAELLAERDLLPGPLQPIVRVRFGFLDALAEIDPPLRLPEHLENFFDAPEIPAAELGRNWRDLVRQATDRLERLTDDDARESWQREHFAEHFATIDRLQAEKQQAAQTDPKDPKVRELWGRIKDRQAEILHGTLQRCVADWQTSQLETWDSRGALLPWCVGLGGKDFYKQLLANARCTEETA